MYLPPFLRLLFKTDVWDFRKKFLFQIDHLNWREFRFGIHDLVFASPLRYVKRSVSEAPIFFWYIIYQVYFRACCTYLQKKIRR